MSTSCRLQRPHSCNLAPPEAHYLTHVVLLLSSLQLSNEMIRLCCRSLSLDRMFQGYVGSSKQTLQDCIDCCVAWKDVYLEAARVHHR